ncbi:TolC family outer membrane protein [Rhodocyclus tenuis]|uniref:TolC family outer membrane protein n=2 Tax=Rhodocyclus TaxID=1064 RepID=A0A6L5JWZ1_RHOTE|nr:TolC family outer membrane protein [Rhodocyclus gracilis]MQY51541.1 TolC family outer membrane protein [Rhodocyclus gracilis]MRD72283.1 TolC family outer membrane protein [Rhodocyclus gracilis]NJA89628.1 TolC family outer membrane protein [Rhodocyclus gracilis]
MKRHALALLVGAVFAASPVFAADLAQVYRDAVAYDAQFAAARANLDAGREKLPQGRSGLLPVISASGNTTWNQNTYSGLTGNGSRDASFNSNGYTVSLTQPLFRWQNIVQYDQAQLQVVQAEATFEQARQDLIVRVAQAYFDVLYAQENLTAVRANKEAIAQQLAQAKKNFEVGTATITDSQEAQSRYDLATAQEIAADSDLEIKRHTLSVIIGKDAGALNPLRNDATLAPPQPAAMANWVDAAEKDSFTVLAQQAAAEVAAREVERNRAGHYPTLDVVASYNDSSSGKTQFGDSRFDSTSRAVGLQLNIPIFQGGYVTSKTREAAANREAANAALDGARRNASLLARQSYLGVVNGIAQVRALEAALLSSNSALESNKLGYEVGVRINIDVLNAEQQVYSTRRDLARARFDTLLAQLRLKAAVGTLSDADLQQINGLLVH